MRLFNRRKKCGTDETMQYGVKSITVAKPQNPVSEQLRTVKTNIDFTSADRQIKALTFTSANISEGKSTVTANTAVTMAQAGKKVLLTNADLHKPTLHQIFDIPSRVGLTTILTSHSNEVDMADIVKEDIIPNLSVIPAGPIPPNPTQLSGSNRTRAFLNMMKEHYDLVVLGLAPILEVSDTQILAGEMDGTVLVVRQGITQKAGVERALEVLKLIKTYVLGYVMNDVRTDPDSYGYSYGYGCGYGYGYGYGYG